VHCANLRRAVGLHEVARPREGRGGARQAGERGEGRVQGLRVGRRVGAVGQLVGENHRAVAQAGCRGKVLDAQDERPGAGADRPMLPSTVVNAQHRVLAVVVKRAAGLQTAVGLGVAGGGESVINC
jgi:hypothetical protein